MATTKKIPNRLCLGCHEQYPKRDLLRVVKSPEGDFSVDISGKKAGRGAYICRRLECLELAMKNHGLERSFKGEVDKEIYQALRKQFCEQIEG